MKAVILAGGFGTRLSEETTVIPKPLVSVGGRPILWHVMKIYHAYGIRDFVICLGYKGYLIKEYFANYGLHNADVTVDTANGTIEYHRRRSEAWRVSLVDTGENSMTGGRLGRIREYIDDTFLATYGDGVGDVDIAALLALHRRMGLEATLTAATPPGRYGALAIADDRVREFQEKPSGDGGVINGGFFVFEPSVLDRVAGDATILEEDVLPALARDGQLAVHNHRGFWQPMDTLRDRRQLEELWTTGAAPWKVWER